MAIFLSGLPYLDPVARVPFDLQFNCGNFGCQATSKYEYKRDHYRRNNIGTQCVDNTDNINEVLREFEAFKEFSGLQTNDHKTVVMPIGASVQDLGRANTVFQLTWTSEPIKIPEIWIHPNMDNMMDRNYRPLLQKTRDTIMIWRYRTMTPLGRIQVVNSLVASLFVYRFLCLPSPSNSYFEEYKQIIRKIIWKDSGNKIRYVLLVRHYEDAGLKLIDLATKGKAFKISWVAKAAVQVPSTSPLHYDLPIKDPYIWDCNFSPHDFNVDTALISRQIWQNWSRINKNTPTNVVKVMAQPLWFNNSILRAKRMWHIKEALEAGLKYIRDIYDLGHDRFLSYNEVINKFGMVISPLQYNGLVGCIPSLWKTILKQQIIGEDSPNRLKMVPQGVKLSKFAYLKAVFQRTIQPQSCCGSMN